MRALAMMAILGIVFARIYILWFNGAAVAEQTFVVTPVDPCDDWTEWFGLGDCAGGVSTFAAITLGLITGLLPIYQIMQASAQSIILIFSVRSLIS